MRIHVLSVAVLLLGIALEQAAGDQTSWSVEFAVSLEKSTFQTIAAGVDLYNHGDPAGCYRLFEGSLLGLGPFLSDEPEYAKMIAVAFASAKKLATPAEKAIELRKPLDQLLLAARKRPVKKPALPSVPESPKEARSTQDRSQPNRIASGAMPAESPLADSESDPDLAIPVRGVTEKPTDPEPGPIGTALKPSTVNAGTLTPKPGDARPETTEPTAPSVAIDPTFWKRIGDTAAMRKIVHDFLFKATNDPRVAFDRGGEYVLDDRALLKIERHVVELLSSRTGGPFTYRGRPLKVIYAKMSVTEAQFDAIIEDLEDVLIVHRVGGRERRELLDVVGRLKPEIVSP